MKNKHIFISGGAGVIGSELVSKLIDLGSTIFVGDLKPKPTNWAGKIKYRQGDLNYITKEEIEIFDPEIFIHLAATFERSTETYEFWEENFWHNIRLSNYLMSIFKEIKTLKKVVFASSYLIYNPILYSFDTPQNKAYRLKESDIISPRNLTGSAKLNHEVELNFLNTFKQNQFSTICARIFRGYGKGSNCVISRWIRSLLEGEEIQLYKKEGIFDYIYAEDIANGLIKILETDDIKGIINLGNDNARKVEDIIKILKKYFHKISITEGDLDIPYEASQANMDYFKHKTKWVPQMQLEETIPLIIEYEKLKINETINKSNNILITSISSKIPLLESVKHAAKKINSNLEVYGGDSNKDCIGADFCDNFWVMPIIEELSIEKFISYCKENSITYIIPTRDGELKYFSKNKEKLATENIAVMVSEYETINFCLDKLKFYLDSKHTQIPIIPTSNNIEEIESQFYVVKEQFGAGSAQIGIKLNKNEAIIHATKLQNPIFQPFIEGREVSIDMYITKNENLKGIVMRNRDIVVNGESVITTTFYDNKLEKICKDFVALKSFYGHIIIQTIIDTDNNYHIIECNSRFGGASTLSIAVGLDSFYWFFLETNNVDISDYLFYNNTELKIKQIRYPKDKILIIS